MISRRKGYKLDRMENNNIDFYKRVREGFLNIAKQSSRFKIIDGTKSIEYIHEQIIHHVRNIL
ncbi:MAG: hypothetical protein KatS3mg002_0842 [Candidatus Woesearchaeota archaeon]|nr:MAG: hypothetical protein KatS3mg002_0842 [Candidatus Woesearchaeota archaeon]